MPPRNVRPEPEEEPKEETALVPAEPPLLPVGEDGEPLHLRPNQHAYLTALAEGKTQKDARVLAGGEGSSVSRQAVHKWFQEVDYKLAYDHLFGVGSIEIHRQELIQAAGETSDLYQEAMSADKEKQVTVLCEHCGKMTKGTVTVEDWGARLRAAEKLDTIAGVLKQTTRVEGEIVHTQMTGAQRIAFYMWQHGEPIPESAKADLRKMGLPVDD